MYGRAPRRRCPVCRSATSGKQRYSPKRLSCRTPRRPSRRSSCSGSRPGCLPVPGPPSCPTPLRPAPSLGRRILLPRGRRSKRRRLRAQRPKPPPVLSRNLHQCDDRRFALEPAAASVGLLPIVGPRVHLRFQSWVLQFLLGELWLRVLRHRVLLLGLVFGRFFFPPCTSRERSIVELSSERSALIHCPFLTLVKRSLSCDFSQVSSSGDWTCGCTRYNLKA